MLDKKGKAEGRQARKLYLQADVNEGREAGGLRPLWLCLLLAIYVCVSVIRHNMLSRRPGSKWTQQGRHMHPGFSRGRGDQCGGF